MKAKIINLKEYKFNKSRDKLIEDLDRSGILKVLRKDVVEKAKLIGINLIPIDDDE